MIGPNQRKWLEALRSGEYRQGKCSLENASGGFCCLGVAANIFGCVREKVDLHFAASYDEEGTYAPPRVIETLALRSRTGISRDPGKTSLSQMNDVGYSFASIVDAIERDPQQYFTEAR